MAQYRTVEGEESTAANTPVNLTTFGSETTGPIKVPKGCTKLIEIWASIGATVDTAADTANYLLRLSGKGMKNGDQDFSVGAVGGGVTNTGTVWAPVQRLPVDVDVVDGENINVAVQHGGSTIIATSMGFTLVFQ